MGENHIGQGYLIVLLAAILVIVAGRLGPAIPILGTRSVSYDLFASVRKDSFPQNQLCDSLQGLDSPSFMTVAGTDDRYPAERPGQYHGFQHLESFFAALQKTRRGKNTLRIGYFGDSMIEGDLLTQSLRNSLQEQLGGQGVGFVPMAAISPGFRRSIRQKFSDDWQQVTCIQDNTSPYPLGISGELFVSRREKGAWVEFQGTSLYPRTESFHQIKMYYGKAETANSGKAQPFASVQLTTGKDTPKERSANVSLAAKGLVNEVSLVNWETEDARISFDFKQKLPVYGFSFEDGAGAYVDNFSVRGHTGLQLDNIPGPVLARFQEYLGFQLLVLHFGLNAMYMYERDGDYARYREGMREVVAHFKKHMPEAAILIVSVTDRGEKIRGSMGTGPSVPLLVQTQMEVARESEVGFLNLYEAMGGANSMVKWVESDPPLANKDYAHFNFQGGDRLAGLIEAYLWEGYNYFDPQASQPIAGLGKSPSSRALHTQSQHD